jgi:PhnB protein
MVQAVPEGVGNVVPYLCVRGAKKAIEFYQDAFGAQVISMMPMGDDLIGHADLKIGASRVYLADEMPGWGAVKSPSTLKGATANIHLWVEDCDAVFARAVAAGASVVRPLADQFWGDRYGMVSDPFGQIWAITSHKEDLTPDEMMRRGKEAMAEMAQAAPPATKPKPRPRAKPAGAASSATKAAAVAQAKSKPKPKAGKKAEKKARSGKKDKSKKSKKSKKDKKRKKKSKR